MDRVDLFWSGCWARLCNVGKGVERWFVALVIRLYHRTRRKLYLPNFVSPRAFFAVYNDRWLCSQGWQFSVAVKIPPH